MSSGRIPAVFKDGRKALIAYITAGDPTPEMTPELVFALERGGVDLIELGVPFSDPIADGPVIQRGAERALKAGTSVKRVLEIAQNIRKKSQIPLLMFTYLNPVLKYGLEALARDAKAAEIDGCLLTDLSVEEALSYTGAMKSAGLDTVFLAAPTSTPARQKLVAEYSSGFVYLVSRTGVTGEQVSISDSLAPLVSSMRAVTKLPLAVGFGIATPGQAREVSKIADGVVVGSAIVRLIEQGGDVEAFARSLRQGMDS
jgi:tryptophan synthase alpha chain